MIFIPENIKTKLLVSATKFIVVLNNDAPFLHEKEHFFNFVKKYNYPVIAVDGGIDFIKPVKPILWVGDGDSFKEHIRSEKLDGLNVLKLLLPEEKDFSDMWAAMEILKEIAAKEVFIFNWRGGRFDQEIFNFFILPFFSLRVTFLSLKENVYYTPDKEISLSLKKGSLLSLIPLTPQVKGVTVKGLKYLLKDDTICQNTQTLSNIVLEEEIFVKWKAGELLLYEFF